MLALKIFGAVGWAFGAFDGAFAFRFNIVIRETGTETDALVTLGNDLGDLKSRGHVGTHALDSGYVVECAVGGNVRRFGWIFVVGLVLALVFVFVYPAPVYWISPADVASTPTTIPAS